MSLTCVEITYQFRVHGDGGVTALCFGAPVDFPYGTVLVLYPKVKSEPAYIFSQTLKVPSRNVHSDGTPKDVPAMLNVTVTDGVYKATVYVPTCPRQPNSFEVLLDDLEQKALAALVSATLMSAKEKA